LRRSSHEIVQGYTTLPLRCAGLKLVGHFYIPDDNASGPRSAIVVGHPVSGKQQASRFYAQRLGELGFATLAFDAAYQGETEDEPRGLEDPAHRVEDIKAAATLSPQAPPTRGEWSRPTAHRSLHANRVPVRDGRDRQVETRSAIALVLERAIGDPTLTVHVVRVRQKVPGLALVEADLTAAPQAVAMCQEPR
jgi:hypothetical protein